MNLNICRIGANIYLYKWRQENIHIFKRLMMIISGDTSANLQHSRGKLSRLGKERAVKWLHQQPSQILNLLFRAGFSIYSPIFLLAAEPESARRNLISPLWSQLIFSVFCHSQRECLYTIQREIGFSNWHLLPKK